MYALTHIGHSVLRRICLYYIPYEYGDRMFGVCGGGGRLGKLLSFLKDTEIVNIFSARKSVMKFVPLLWSIVSLSHPTFWHDHISWYAGIEIRPGTCTARYRKGMTRTASFSGPLCRGRTVTMSRLHVGGKKEAVVLILVKYVSVTHRCTCFRL